jgi:hypothetical protein
VSLIQTPEQLANAIRNDPQRVAECLHRIHRFGGQVQHCTVLRHSLEVYHRIDADPDSSDAARLWALLHDCHEILTGDVVRPYVNARLRMDQQAIDDAIVRRLPLLVPQPESMSWESVVAADRAVGEWEMLEIGQGKAPYSLYQFPAKSWADLVRDLIGGAA